MKYGIYTAYWLREWAGDYKKYIAKAADLGFDILEISCAVFARQYAAQEDLLELKNCALGKGIILTAGYGPSKEQNLASDDKSIVKNAFAFFKDILEKLKFMGIKNLGGGLYSYWPVDYSKPFDKKADWKRSVENMKELAKIAEDCDVVLGMEALNRFEGYMINTCEEALQFVCEVNHPNVKIMLDTFHMNIEEDNIAKAIRLAGNNLGHLHVGEQNRKVPGRGSIPWNEIGIALEDINYSGGIVMEPFVLEGGTVGSEIKVWRNMVSDSSEEALDRDAKGALEFLKHVFKRQA